MSIYTQTQVSVGKDGRRKEEEEGRGGKEDGKREKKWKKGGGGKDREIPCQDSKQPTTAVLCPCFKQLINGHAQDNTVRLG